MFYSSRTGTRKQTSFMRTSTSSKFEDGNKSGNETDRGSAELLNISREDLSPSRCSCHSGGSNVAAKTEVKDGGSEHFWAGNLRLELDNNASGDDELLKDELLRIFDRERLGLESYFKQKTENILAGYRRKQYDWEEKLRLERMEYEKNLAQEKIEVQQNYISEMTNLTKQFNQERVELESHYKKQIEELSQQFDLRKKEMDATIIKERTELKQRLEVEYQAMLKSQRSTDEQRFHQQILELEERYKKRILELEQKLKDSFSEGELSGRRLQSELEAKFENEKSLVVVEWRKRVEILEIELGKEKERANNEERKSSDSHAFLRKEISKKDVEVEKLRQVVETLKLELSHKDKTTKEHELLQQNIFLRGSDALPGKLREDFEKMLAAHREELERNLRKEREGLETEREKRLVLERETMEKQLKVERERISLDLEKERCEMRQVSREKEGKLREEVKDEMEGMRRALETEKESLREQVRADMMKERNQIGETFLKEKEARDAEIGRQLKLTLGSQDERKKRKDVSRESKAHREDSEEGAKLEGDERVVRDHARQRGEEGLGQNHVRFEAEEAERRRNGLGRDDYEVWLAGQRMQHTKQWVEGQYRYAGDSHGYIEDSAEFESKVRYTGHVGEDETGEDGQGLNKVKSVGLPDNNPGYFDGGAAGRGRFGMDNKDCNEDDEGLKMVRQGEGGDDLLQSQNDLKGVLSNKPNKDGEQNNAGSRPTNMSKNPEKNGEYSVRGLKEENKGLKAKVGALQENIELHKCFKREASEEVERLRNTNKDWKMKLDQLNKDYEELQDTLKDYEELKDTLKDYEEQLKDYEGQLKDNEVKLKEYEDNCYEYETTLQKCRQKISIIENDPSGVRDPNGVRDMADNARNPVENNTLKDYEELKQTLKDYEVQLEDYEGQLKGNAVKLKEYEDICYEYETTLQNCRQKISIIENDPSGVRDPNGVRDMADNARNPSGNISKDPKGELKDTLKDYEMQLKDQKKQLKDNAVKIKDYEDICNEYERTLQKCRQRIMVFENDRETSTRNTSGDSRNRSGNVSKNWKETSRQHQEIVDNEDSSGNSGYLGSKHKPSKEMVVNILENEKARLESIVKSLEEKTKLLEVKISEITLANYQAGSEEKAKLSSDVERVRRQNKGLLKKIKDLQCQLQGMVDKLRKKKKKIASLKNEKLSLKSSHQCEINDLRQKLEYSGHVITRLQHESTTESTTVTVLQEEVSNLTKMMMEERVCEQRMLKAQSIEEMDRLRDMDREKLELEKKLYDARTALDCYSQRLKNKMCSSELSSSQLSLNTDATFYRDMRLSKTIKALDASQKTSRRQTERLQHEKQELQTLIGRLCKSQEDLSCVDGSREVSTYSTKVSLMSRSSSISSSLSSSCVSLRGLESGLGSTQFSSNFSFFD